LFFLSFHDWIHDRAQFEGATRWFDAERLHRLALMFTPAGAFAVGALAVIAVGALVHRGWRARSEWRLEPADAVAILGAALLVAACDLFAPFAAFVVANVLIVAAVLLLIVRGVRHGRV